MKIYSVTTSVYDADGVLVESFATRELAQKYIECRKKADAEIGMAVGDFDYAIEEHELNNSESSEIFSWKTETFFTYNGEYWQEFALNTYSCKYSERHRKLLEGESWALDYYHEKQGLDKDAWESHLRAHFATPADERGSLGNQKDYEKTISFLTITRPASWGRGKIEQERIERLAYIARLKQEKGWGEENIHDINDHIQSLND